ncbi:hypothetical protein TWF694_009998 [Orbilia ellipsospora]|uniref:Uncharacterized protein n=1 Tax=Orbilia ellipsospora TaxID=2528407 RepID=A0AAV9XDE3_9PEZI
MSKFHLSFEAKRGFVLSQIRILSQDIVPDQHWNEDIGDTEITSAALEGILQKVNRISRRHYQIFYNSPAIDHVTEQLSVLYQQPNHEFQPNSCLNILEGRADLTQLRTIEKLPEAWPENDDDDGEEVRHQYKILVARLSSMAAGMNNIRAKHKCLLEAKKRIDGLADPSSTIQPNLMFKEGELVSELKRMRILAAKLVNELEGSKPMLQRNVILQK